MPSTPRRPSANQGPAPCGGGPPPVAGSQGRVPSQPWVPEASEGPSQLCQNGSRLPAAPGWQSGGLELGPAPTSDFCQGYSHCASPHLNSSVAPHYPRLKSPPPGFALQRPGELFSSPCPGLIMPICLWFPLAQPHGFTSPQLTLPASPSFTVSL